MEIFPHSLHMAIRLFSYSAGQQGEIFPHLVKIGKYSLIPSTLLFALFAMTRIVSISFSFTSNVVSFLSGF
jgi:hypothetical protein